MSNTNKRIAEFLTQHPNEMAVGSVNTLVRKCGVHASSQVRFAQLVGFNGFRDLQELFQRRLAMTARVFFSVPEPEYTFSRSLAAPMCLAQALILGLAARQSGDESGPRIPVVTAPRVRSHSISGWMSGSLLRKSGDELSDFLGWQGLA